MEAWLAAPTQAAHRCSWRPLRRARSYGRRGGSIRWRREQGAPSTPWPPPLPATPPRPRNHRRHRRQRVQRARAAGVVAAAPSRPRRVRRPRREAAQHGSRRSEVASPWEAALDGRRSRRGRPVGCGRSPAAGWAQAGPRPQPPAVAARRRRGCRAGDAAPPLWTSGREWLPAVGAAWRIEKEVKEMRRIYI